MPNLTGSPFSSKKFIAFLIAEISWKVIMLLTLFWGHDKMPNQLSLVLIAIVLTGGFLEVGYILGQAYIDKYVQVALAIAQKTPPEDTPESDPGSVGGPVQPND